MNEKHLIFLIFCLININIFSQNTATILVHNPDGVTTNLGTGVDVKSLNQLKYDTNNVRDTVSVFINNYRKIYIRNESFFKTVTIEKKDTLSIEIIDNKLKYKILNKQLRKYDTLGVYKLIKVNLRKTDSLVENFKKKLFGKQDTNYSYKITDKIHVDYDLNTYKEYYFLLKDFTSKQLQFLDKILEKKLISKPNYEKYISEIKFNLFSTLLKAYWDTDDDFFKNEIIRTFFKDEAILEDDFSGYGYINQFVTRIVLKGNFVESFTRIQYDYKKAFNSLPNIFSGNLLKYAQHLCLSKIAESTDIKEFEEYLKKYKNRYGEHQYLQRLKTNNFINDSSFKKHYDNVELIDSNGDYSSLSDVVNSNYGRLIYIDFWASWCAPCRALMPKSRNLHKKFKNKEVIFVYVSIDKDYDKWVIANKKEQLDKLNTSFFAKNYSSGKFYKELNINKIPRYLLIGREGGVILKDAPNPSSKLTELLLNSLLLKIN